MTNKEFDFETAVIRVWSGRWENNNPNLPVINNPRGGYVITFHNGLGLPYKAEHYNTVEEILLKYQYRYFWFNPDPSDDPDIVLTGI